MSWLTRLTERSREWGERKQAEGRARLTEVDEQLDVVSEQWAADRARWAAEREALKSAQQAVPSEPLHKRISGCGTQMMKAGCGLTILGFGLIFLLVSC